MIQVPALTVKELLEAVDEVAWEMYRLHEAAGEEDYAQHLLNRLRNAKWDFENKAKSIDGGSDYLK